LAGLDDGRLADLSASLSADICAALGYTGQGFVPLVAPNVPEIVSRLQAMLALNAAGLLATVETLISKSDASTQIYWADAPEFHRENPILLSIAARLGLAPAQIDALFISAATFT